MPVFIAPETTHGKELWMWDHYEDEIYPQSDPDKPIRGKRKRGFQPFPVMLYKAGRNDQNQIDVIMPGKQAHSEAERAQLEREGYVIGPDLAVAKAEALEQDIAVAAAERDYTDRKMSPAAQAEARAYDASVAEHVAEIPRTPVRKRGRPRKIDTTGA